MFLEELPIGGVRAFYLKVKENSRMGSVLLCFSQEGITITGDGAPGHNGIVSAFGYSTQWFYSKLSPDYLCSKFLQKEWSAMVMARAIETSAEANSDNYNDKQRLVESLRAGCIGRSDVLRALEDMNELDWWEGGFDYPEGDAKRLIEIQENFRQLFNDIAET